MQRILAGDAHGLHRVDQTRDIEALAQSHLPPHTLMERAGLAVARLASALSPHAQDIWIACGPGNNGGDGLEAAVHLHKSGKNPLVTLISSPDQLPPDAKAAFAKAQHAGVRILSEPPDSCDLCIDALLGIGVKRATTGDMARLIDTINKMNAPVLSIDVPSGLDADRGACAGPWVRAEHTLSLLTLKPGLFTGHGRDAAGAVWLDTLSCDAWLANCSPSIRLTPRPTLQTRQHNSHKGSYGDVGIIGGADGMAGAAILAGTAALHGGAGRVYIDLLGSPATCSVAPDLMLRTINGLDTTQLTVVCGCGGGEAIRTHLPKLLSSYPSMVIDADAINAIANDISLQQLLKRRQSRGWQTVLTPHPLEAARLLQVTTSEIQANRLVATQQLVANFGCTVVLKGSGTTILSPGETCSINPTGNARLATAGTGDVLAGLIGARLANGLRAHEAACSAVYRHGELADGWPQDQPLSAEALARSATPT